jgi:uncharacterized membrane protein YkvA (DUF1232 family)
MGRTSNLGSRIAHGAFFGRLKGRALRYLRDPQKLQTLVQEGWTKAGASGGRGVLAEVWESLRTLLRLIRAYARGDYRDVPTGSLVLIVAAVLYFVLPIDLIPDFIVGLGYVDDVAILGWVINMVGGSLRAFAAWEASRPASPAGRHEGLGDQRASRNP